MLGPNLLIACCGHYGFQSRSHSGHYGCSNKVFDSDIAFIISVGENLNKMKANICFVAVSDKYCTHVLFVSDSLWMMEGYKFHPSDSFDILALSTTHRIQIDVFAFTWFYYYIAKWECLCTVVGET